MRSCKMILVYLMSFTLVVPVFAMDHVLDVKGEDRLPNLSNMARDIDDNLFNVTPCDVVNDNKSFVCTVGITNYNDVVDKVCCFDKVIMWLGPLACCCVAGPMVGVILMN